MKFCIDIDNTICRTKREKYETAEPIIERIKTINKLYEEGHTIIILTARGSETGKDWKELTKTQLSDWGVKHHRLVFGKPAADFYVDDKNLETWWLGDYPRLKEVLPTIEKIMKKHNE